MNKKRILIFASGRGSNAEAIHEAVMDGRINGEVVGVICDHKGAQVLERAARWHVPSVVIDTLSGVYLAAVYLSEVYLSRVYLT